MLLKNGDAFYSRQRLYFLNGQSLPLLLVGGVIIMALKDTSKIFFSYKTVIIKYNGESYNFNKRSSL